MVLPLPQQQENVFSAGSQFLYFVHLRKQLMECCQPWQRSGKPAELTASRRLLCA
jgi:hypothetical protein